MQSYATYTWSWQNSNSVWSPSWMRQAAAYQQPPSPHQASYGYYNNNYYAYEQPQPQPAPPPSSWQPPYSEVYYDPSEIHSNADLRSMFLRLMVEQDKERSGAYYLSASASEPEEVMEDDNATYAYVDLQEFLKLMAEQDQERSGAYYLSASEPENIMEKNNTLESLTSPAQDLQTSSFLIETLGKKSETAEAPDEEVIMESEKVADVIPLVGGAIANGVEIKEENFDDVLVGGAIENGIERLILQQIPLHKIQAEIMERGDLRNMNNAVCLCFSLCMDEKHYPSLIFVVDEFDSIVSKTERTHGINVTHINSFHGNMVNTSFCIFDPGGGISCRCSLLSDFHLEDKVVFNGGGDDTGIS